MHDHFGTEELKNSYQSQWASSRENLSSGFAPRQDSNRHAQLQTLARARVLKFWV